MLVAEQQDKLLSSNGVFRPNGLNDERRVDMSDDPFYAIDRKNPHEIDDAIRVDRLSDGFLVRVAMGDGAQVSPHGEIFNSAVIARSNIYVDRKHSRLIRSILPEQAVRELELSRSRHKRALVVSQVFDDSSTPVSTELTPAYIHVEEYRNHTFGGHFLHRLGEGARNIPIVAFASRYRQAHGLPSPDPFVLGGLESAQQFSSRLVSTYMVLANIAFASWAQENEVPILYRTFEGNQGPWDEEGGLLTRRAEFTSDPELHNGLPIQNQTATTYAQGSSPLRRGVDLVNHTQAGHHIAGLELPYSYDNLGVLSHYFNHGLMRSLI